MKKMGESGADEDKIKIIVMLLQEIKCGDDSKPLKFKKYRPKKSERFHPESG